MSTCLTLGVTVKKAKVPISRRVPLSNASDLVDCIHILLKLKHTETHRDIGLKLLFPSPVVGVGIFSPRRPIMTPTLRVSADAEYLSDTSRVTSQI